ncbi:MAG: ABC transporter ATP-binding protein [Candidatus Velthaea sp.]|jgi:ABC-2 type transport system ATP-binding protein
MNPIEVRNLRKTYGSFAAVADLSLSVPAGSVCGLLGPNGAGKSTAFKCLTGLARASGGSIEIAGGPPRPAMFAQVAFVPERSALYGHLTVGDHLTIARGSFPKYDERRARKMLEIFSLDAKKRVKKLSKGQQTALGLALAFAMCPTIMILDEPASGLDPIHQRAVLDLIIEAAANGSAILFSSHNVGQVERAADRIAIIKGGRLVLDGELDELREREKIVEAVFASVPAEGAFVADGRIRAVERRGNILRLHTLLDTEHIVADLERAGATSVTVRPQDLESLFFAAVEQPRPVTLEAD